MAFDKSVFGNRLRTLMREGGDTIYTLAAYLNLRPSTVSRYTSGMYVPKAPTLSMMAKRYGVNPAWLMGEEENKAPSSPFTPSLSVPILGDVAAGTPIWAEENYEGRSSIDEGEHIDFALRVRGDSMTGARIFSGDIVYVRRQPKVENGEIAVVLVDNEATVKRVFLHPDKVVLKPENDAYQDMVYYNGDGHDVCVLGKVIFVKGRVD